MERRGPAVCDVSANTGGKGEMIKAPDHLQDLRRKLYVKAKAELHWRFWGLYAIPESSGRRLGTVGFAGLACHAGAVQRLPRASRSAESLLGATGLINRDVKRTGERSAGNPHATFDVAGAGNVAWLRCCDTRITERASNREHKLQPTLTRQSSTLPRSASCSLSPHSGKFILRSSAL